MKKFKLKAMASSLVMASVLIAGCSGKEERESKYLQNAQKYYEEKNLDKAKIELKNVLQINPNNAKARFLLAEMDEKEQNWKGMFTNLTVAAENDPSHIEALYKLGLLYMASNDVEKVEEQAKKIETANPSAAEHYALKAIVAQRNEKLEEAAELARKALAIDPANVAAVGILIVQESGKDAQSALKIVSEGLKKNKDEQALNLMKLRLLEEQGKTDEVIDVFNTLIKAQPDEPGMSYQLAQYLVSKERIDEAEKVLKEAIAQHPKKSEPKLWLVGFIQRYKDAESARSMLETFYAENKQNAEIRNALASRYLGDKQVDKAKKLYTEVIDESPKSADAIDARNKLIAIYNQENDRKTIESLLKEIFELESENAEALATRAALHRRDGNIEAAIADLRVARKVKPDSFPIVYSLANAQEAAGVAELAIENYRAALELQPDNIESSLGIARLLYQKRDVDKALEMLKTVNKKRPDNVEAINLLMAIYGEKQNWSEAMELVNPLLLKSDTAALGFYLKARVLVAQKDVKGAEEALKQSLAKKPSPEALRDMSTLLVAQNRPKEALALLDDAQKQIPEAAFVDELRAGVYMATGEFGTANTLFTKLIEKNPAESGYYRKQMQVLMALNKPSAEILAFLDSGISRVANNTELKTLKAEYLQSINKPLDALALYEAMLVDNPKSILLQNNIVALILDYAPTKENLEKAQKLSVGLLESQNPALLDTVGWLQYKLGNYPQALSLLQDARKKGSQGAVYDYHLGMAYYQAGNKDKAKELLTAALANDKEQYVGKEEAQKVLAELK